MQLDVTSVLNSALPGTHYAIALRSAASVDHSAAYKFYIVLVVFVAASVRDS